jgi:hypothetical protein
MAMILEWYYLVIPSVKSAGRAVAQRRIVATPSQHHEKRAIVGRAKKSQVLLPLEIRLWLDWLELVSQLPL